MAYLVSKQIHKQLLHHASPRTLDHKTPSRSWGLLEGPNIGSAVNNLPGLYSLGLSLSKSNSAFVLLVEKEDCVNCEKLALASQNLNILWNSIKQSKQRFSSIMGSSTRHVSFMRLPHISLTAAFFAYFSKMHIWHIFPHKLAFLTAILIFFCVFYLFLLGFVTSTIWLPTEWHHPCVWTPV